MNSFEALWDKFPELADALDNLGAVLLKKNGDYAKDGTFSLFESVAELQGTDAYAVLETMIGLKTVRLKNLRTKGVQPLNESTLDTIRDRAGYAVIQYAYALAQDRRGVEPAD